MIECTQSEGLDIQVSSGTASHDPNSVSAHFFIGGDRGPIADSANPVADQLQILYFNARSLVPKLDYLRVLCAAQLPDIVCITETWLDNSISDNELTIPGYCIIRLDRNRHGGGVLMYIRCTLQTQVLSLGPFDLEFMIVSVNNAKCRYCMGLFYRPPSSTSLIFDTLFSVLEQLDPSLFLNYVLIGDFNVNFLNPQHFLYHKLSCILSSFNLTQVVQQPTHVSTNGGATLIDLVLVSNPQQLQDCSVIPELSNSDHKGISVTMRWKTVRDCGPKTSRPIWRYAWADFSRACELLDATNWDPMMAMDIDQAWEFWQQKFLNIMEQCIPKGSLPKRKCAPWVSKQIVSAIRKRNTCYRRAKQTGSHELLSKYKHLRNRVVHMVKRGKRDYLNNLKSASSKDFWKAVKNLNGRQCSIPTLNHSGETATSDNEKATMLNNFFSSCFNQSIPPISPSGGSERLDPIDCPPELLCTEDEVLELLLALDTSKANGPDNISAKMLKSTAVSIAPVLTKLLNLSITTGKLPSAWKTSSVVPIPKTENRSDAKNYRPISLLSVTSEILERHIHGKILMHLQSAYPLSESQWGFCSGKSTIQALLTATNDWLEMMESGIEAAAVFFDFTKAFDSVPHKPLIEKL